MGISPHNSRRGRLQTSSEMTRAARLIPLLVAASFPTASAFNSTTSCYSRPSHLPNLPAEAARWRERYMADHQSSYLGGAASSLGTAGPNTVAAWALSFLAAAVSSAGGVGGGSLFLPILNLVAGLSLKRAATYSSFMVTGGTVSNVLYNLVLRGGRLIDYDIALLFQPCLLLGVSIGVVCNVVFPEWLITALFALFLASCTAKTCGAGARIWRSEGGSGGRGDYKELLLPRDGGSLADGAGFPWKDVALLVMVWLCFFALHVLIGDKHGKGMIQIKPCGLAYWLITLSQFPFAVTFTWYIIYAKGKKQVVVQHDQENGKENLVDAGTETLPTVAFPVAAFVTGALSGLFGIGGGLLLNPVLLQIGIPPQTAAATATFMVLFCASMSMVQFILLGMKGICEASIYGGICFVASVFGCVVIHRAISKSGRVSLIVFLVTAIMALSTVIVVCVGTLDIWVQYTSGAYMGFKLPCPH